MRKSAVFLLIVMILVSGCATTTNRSRITWSPPIQSAGVPTQKADAESKQASPVPNATEAAALELYNQLQATSAVEQSTWEKPPVNVIPAGDHIDKIFPAVIRQYDTTFMAVGKDKGVDPDVLALTALLMTCGNSSFNSLVNMATPQPTAEPGSEVTVGSYGMGAIWFGNFATGHRTTAEMTDPENNIRKIADLWLEGMKAKNVTNIRTATVRDVYAIAMSYMDGPTFFDADHKTSGGAIWFGGHFQYIYRYIREGNPDWMNGPDNNWFETAAATKLCGDKLEKPVIPTATPK